MIAAANSPMILACQTREDVEFAAGGKFTNKAWATIAANAGDKGVSIGRYLIDFRQDLLVEKMLQFLNEEIGHLVRNPDGTPRPKEEAMKRLDAWLQNETERKEQKEFQRAKECLDNARANRPVRRAGST
ncbi:hypothetical protein LAL4801_05835 [Roseibium aggregatum]|uniref:Uncharacterized protein n=2 Tax=Roseibium aggregatum TaxID=187304 RepID=A0A0M6YCZ6_9HYPH|nr:hypothetical protein LAL4801_05835 [Roseibium aggregatum]